jgi:hypothetical protein
MSRKVVGSPGGSSDVARRMASDGPDERLEPIQFVVRRVIRAITVTTPETPARLSTAQTAVSRGRWTQLTTQRE